jgi:hypothetical protein
MGGRRAKKKAEQQAAQQALDTFKRAAGTCLEGRGYAVR